MYNMDIKTGFITPPRGYYAAQKMLERAMRGIAMQKERALRRKAEQDAEQDEDAEPLPPLPPPGASRQVRRAWLRECRKVEERNRRRGL